jgi:thiamine-phosphate pyrophosphorylase
MTSPSTISEGRLRGLYAIADTRYVEPARLVAAARAAIEGGARIIQYRDKTGDPARRLIDARALAKLCKSLGALFLINDDVALVRIADADGVHLGRNDLSLVDARAALGRHAVIGVSCYNELARAEEAALGGADYLAFGSFFPSRTKPHAVRANPDLLREARTRFDLPLVAIGGITPENGGSLIEAGADALAVIEGVFGQADIRAAAQRYARLFTTT